MGECPLPRSPASCSKPDDGLIDLVSLPETSEQSVLFLMGLKVGAPLSVGNCPPLLLIGRSGVVEAFAGSLECTGIEIRTVLISLHLDTVLDSSKSFCVVSDDAASLYPWVALGTGAEVLRLEVATAAPSLESHLRLLPPSEEPDLPPLPPPFPPFLLGGVLDLPLKS